LGLRGQVLGQQRVETGTLRRRRVLQEVRETALRIDAVELGACDPSKTWSPTLLLPKLSRHHEVASAAEVAEVKWAH
jgi:hypothetical protein